MVLDSGADVGAVLASEVSIVRELSIVSVVVSTGEEVGAVASLASLELVFSTAVDVVT